jgi:hypothetical protein
MYVCMHVIHWIQKKVQAMVFNFKIVLLLASKVMLTLVTRVDNPLRWLRYPQIFTTTSGVIVLSAIYQCSHEYYRPIHWHTWNENSVLTLGRNRAYFRSASVVHRKINVILSQGRTRSAKLFCHFHPLHMWTTGAVLPPSSYKCPWHHSERKHAFIFLNMT